MELCSSRLVAAVSYAGCIVFFRKGFEMIGAWMGFCRLARRRLSFTRAGMEPSGAELPVRGSRSQQSGQSGEIVGGHREGEAGIHPVQPSAYGLGHAAGPLGPTECLINLLAVCQ